MNPPAAPRALAALAKNSSVKRSPPSEATKWQLLRLPEFDAELQRLPVLAQQAIASRLSARVERQALASELESFQRGGPAPTGIDALASPSFAGSIILLAHGDHRVTAWCPTGHRALVATHVFRRVHDVGAKKAARLHEERLAKHAGSSTLMMGLASDPA